MSMQAVAGPRQGQIACAATISRRDVAALTTSLFLARPFAAAGAAEGLGEFVTAKNGLQYRDDVIGDGPLPVKGARIRCESFTAGTS
jgi:hypothetical protein